MTDTAVSRPRTVRQREPRRGVPVLPVLAAAAIGGGVAVVQSVVVRGFDALLPDARGISHFNRPGTLTILAADGSVVQKQGPVSREKLSSGAIPPLVERAFIAAEDRRFYNHDGVDVYGISRAMVRNISRGSVEEGASTITQQLARTVFLSQDRTLLRKLKEAALAGKLERQLGKRQILTEYLNVVYLGSSAYGVSDAAWVYFSKSPEQLTLPEAALIAGLPPAPSVYSPLVNPEVALRRRSIVLERMREAGFIDDEQLQRAEAAPLALKPAEPKFFHNPAPWYTSWLEQELPKVLSREQLEVGGLTIRSGLNAAWQAEAQKTIDPYATGSMEGALVAMEPRSGRVLAMVGGYSFSLSNFNRATQAMRQPGSAIKPFVYAAALEPDGGFTPASYVTDAQITFKGGVNGEDWTPENYNKKYYGSMPLRRGLELSRNAMTVRLAQSVGMKKIVALIEKFGIVRSMEPVLAMALGAGETTPFRLTAAYTAFVNNGRMAQPHLIELVQDREGKVIYRADQRECRGCVAGFNGEESPRIPPAGEQIIDPITAFQISSMLEGVVQRGTATQASVLGRPVAGKTGTTNEYRSAWFVGFTHDIVVGVFVGFDDNRSLGEGEAGGVSALPIFVNFMQEPSLQALPPTPFKAPKTATFMVVGGHVGNGLVACRQLQQRFQ